MNEEAMKLLDDPESIFEAMGADGIHHDFDTDRSGMSDTQRKARVQHVNAEDDKVALAIGELIKIALAENVPGGDNWKGHTADACLGAMMRNQITKHLELIAETE